MNDKRQILATLRAEFDRWEELLASLPEKQIAAPRLPGSLSIKDVVAHLWAWQQLSIARLEAALYGREPEFHLWPSELDPDSEDDIDQINAWIHRAYRDKAWPLVHGHWREGFLRFLELGEAIPEGHFYDPEKYPWLRGYPLVAVLTGSLEHHHDDHLEPLRAWIHQRGLDGA